MGSLKQFIIQEELKVSHADRYLTYVERFHNEVFLDLKSELSDRWAKAVDKLNKKYRPTPEDMEAVQLQNPKALTELELSTRSEKLVTSRSHVPLEISPSVKIPFIFKKEERDLILERLIEAANDAIRSTTARWKEIFNFEHRGRVAPWFKIVSEKDEIRLQLAMSEGSEQSYRTLYSVRVEYGRSGMKLRQFNRIYLTTSI